MHTSDVTAPTKSISAPLTLVTGCDIFRTPILETLWTFVCSGGHSPASSRSS